MSHTIADRFAPMPRAGERVHGLSRSAIYLQAAAGHIVLKKYGTTVLVDVQSVLTFVSALPDATIKRTAA